MLVGVPTVYGKTLDEAKALLTGRGLTAGVVNTVASTLPPGTVVSPATTSLVASGSAVNLSVSGGTSGTSTGTGTPGGTGIPGGSTGTGSSTTSPITNPSSPAAASLLVHPHVVACLLAREAALHRRPTSTSPGRRSITATLLDPAGKSVYTWRLRVGTGSTLVRLAVPAKVKKAGRYTVVWNATSAGETIRRRFVVTSAPSVRRRPPIRARRWSAFSSPGRS